MRAKLRALRLRHATPTQDASSDPEAEAEFTLVESPEAGSRGLVVRRVAGADKKAVRRWGGFLFATMAEAETFAQSQMLFGEDGPPWARQAFARKRVDGLRIYVRLGGVC